MTTLTLSDPDGETWTLYNVQRDEDDTRADDDTFNSPGISSDRAFITILSEAETFSLTGLVTAPRLSQQSKYSSDWRTALAEYAQRGEAFASSAQDTGYTLEHNVRNRTSLNVVIESLTWTYERGAINQLSYELTLRRGGGLLPDSTISVGSATPGTSSAVTTLGGQNLSGFERIELEKSMGELTVVERAFADTAGENDIYAEQGMTRTYSYRGKFPGSASTRNSFDDTIRGYIDDSAYSLATIWPGYSVDVKVLDYSSNRSWDHGEQMHEYEITMREAQ